MLGKSVRMARSMRRCHWGSRCSSTSSTKTASGRKSLKKLIDPANVNNSDLARAQIIDWELSLVSNT